ncbi:MULTISPECIES: nucleotide disphospho-sugar-binding domain-containing protein [Brevibacterium]|uniref:nucleotide disphospho-sugar-binding domain-containing protein n=1 Tax=Brevibacterium TaxID=1696 RepID=UPI0030B87D87
MGPPLYGLLYPIVSLAQSFRVSGHDVVVASAGGFADKIATAGLVAYNAAPDLDSEADYKRRELDRLKNNAGTKPGDFSFFSEEMSDALVDFTDAWRPDLIVYPPLGVVGPLLGTKFDIPTVMLTVGFMHGHKQIDIVSQALRHAYDRHGVGQRQSDLAWIDVAPPSISILDRPDALPMRYVPYNGGTVLGEGWQKAEGRRRVVVSLGTLKPMVEGSGLIDWILRDGSAADIDFVVQLGHNARQGIPETLPSNVSIVDWIPMGPMMGEADCFIHHGGAGNTLTACDAGIPQIIFGEGADRPTNANLIRSRGCGVIPRDGNLTGSTVLEVLGNPAIAANAREVQDEMHSLPTPPQIVAEIAARIGESAQTELTLVGRR